MGEQWHFETEVTAGDTWIAIAHHAPVENLERIHQSTRPQIGMWLSSSPNAAYGSFVSSHWPAEYAHLGAIVAVPADMPMRVRVDAEPARRMLHCRLPAQPRATAPSRRALAACFDLRSTPITASLRRMAAEAETPGFASTAMIEGLGLFVSAELARHLKQLSNEMEHSRGGLAPWQLRRIDEHLRDGHWDSCISDLARLCGVSASHAMRAFRQSKGKSIGAHVADLRIAHARALLTAGHLSVGEIAAELRFAQPSSFAAAFRRAMGMTPNDYRQRAERGA
jgi:AraC family transcriptional regulator